MAADSESSPRPPSSHTSNALEVSLACLSTWFGRPKAAGSIIIDPDDPLSALRGEQGGRDRAETWVGRRFEYLGPDSAAYELIVERLRLGGHGTAALIVNGWPPHLGTGTHAWNAFNDQGRIRWFDPEFRAGDDPFYPEPYGVWALFVDKDWRPPE